MDEINQAIVNLECHIRELIKLTRLSKRIRRMQEDEEISPRKLDSARHELTYFSLTPTKVAEDLRAFEGASLPPDRLSRVEDLRSRLEIVVAHLVELR